jgi:hypothetical protein
MMRWQDYLEIVGVELFLRYRKRLMSPGITLEILRDHPGASLIDIVIRVHAGRQLLREGHDFDALTAIRNGGWSPAGLGAVEAAPPRRRRDRLSRSLVATGGLMFAGFCLLSLSDITGAATGLGLAGLVAAVAAVQHARKAERRELQGRREVMP